LTEAKRENTNAKARVRSKRDKCEPTQEELKDIRRQEQAGLKVVEWRGKRIIVPRGPGVDATEGCA